MTSLIFRTAAHLLFVPMLVFSIYFLLAGHQTPGGGFVGGLMGGAAFSLQALAFDAAAARRRLRIEPGRMAAAGLLIALMSGAPALFLGKPFLTGIWFKAPLGPLTFDLGTPLVFDIGVYLAVMGVLLTLVFALEEKG